MKDNTNNPKFEGTNLVVGKEGEAAVYDAKFLISTLLVYVAKGDGHIDSSETNRMIDIISTHFDASGAETMGLLTDAARTFADRDNLVDKLRNISKELSEDQCNEVFDMLLEVMMADGELPEREIFAVEFAGKILGLSQDGIHSRIRGARQ